MKAAVFQGKGNIHVEDQEERALYSKEVHIRVKACGICGTDQHIFHGHPGSAEVIPPVILGHELSGEVVELGGNVTSLQVGDRVSVDPNIYCGGCEYCRNGRPHLCNHLQAIGVTRDGGMGEYCIVPEENCYRLPDEISFVEGAMVEPLGCVLHGFRKLDIRFNQTVLIIGGGFIGQLFLQLIKKQGVSSIVVSEPSENKHKLLHALGADIIINPLSNQSGAVLRNKADIVIECVGRKESMELACLAAKKGGQILLFGVSSPETKISVSPFEIFAKELKIMGSFINPYTHEEAISLIHQKIVSIEPLISHFFNLDNISETMKSYSTLQVSKGVIVPQENV
ncbi:zinc-dependent alcohol dehydrogenase family protein [Bacillus sp. DX1.1]|uniref:zinc-dependent alcohol dehydrogenase family protein n=1 Tax=unclassified Bacillus (in: firmicutes) TaxID=185979 RepID=UPI002571015A|nr:MULTISPECIES: zinc-dependent alcohol dehydrogenase family protein [unclassified Bacillus (in: firmicutes)]MDM5153120.1 zinc-dependent alcohol dehydrogenase family protein [Bacillus sp. DX1.1]WJE82091.1 zinc-dependent alcohol dehydrogenase family protein [Bacillus sp. DX3.1]